MNDMRKLMEMVGRADDETAYIAAKLYLSAEKGTTKPELAKELSYKTTVGLQAAILMIDAIDAYEDLREAPEEWGLNEASKDDDPTCDWCGGKMQWCPVCNEWTKTCCQDYGTCQCS